jgi:hypothetical protein
MVVDHGEFLGLVETVTLSEAIAEQVIDYQGLNETVGLAESSAEIAYYLQSLSEMVVLSEAIEVDEAEPVHLSESVGLSEASSSHLDAIVGLTEDVSLAEALATDYQEAVDLSEPVSLSEMLVVRQQCRPQLSESWMITEAVAAGSISSSVSVAYTVPVLESMFIQAQQHFAVSLSESVVLYDPATVYAQYREVVLDNVTLSESEMAVSRNQIVVDYSVVPMSESLNVKVHLAI